MLVGDSYAFSPFSPLTVSGKQERALLLQFFLSEILATHQACCEMSSLDHILSFSPPCFPYDWARTNGRLNIALEHSSLLLFAFPKLKSSVEKVSKAIEKLMAGLKGQKNLDEETKDKISTDLKTLLTHTEKLLQECKENENLIYFLLKEKHRIDALMGEDYLLNFLLKTYPKGLEWLEGKLSDSYHKRGFFSLIPELKQLISELEKAHV